MPAKAKHASSLVEAYSQIVYYISAQITQFALTCNPA